MHQKFACTKKLFSLNNYLHWKITWLINFLHWKNIYIEKLLSLKKLFTFKNSLHWKTTSHRKMLHLKLCWALDVKSMYENFPFPRQNKSKNSDSVICIIVSSHLPLIVKNIHSSLVAMEPWRKPDFWIVDFEQQAL